MTMMVTMMIMMMLMIVRLVAMIVVICGVSGINRSHGYYALWEYNCTLKDGACNLVMQIPNTDIFSPSSSL